MTEKVLRLSSLAVSHVGIPTQTKISLRTGHPALVIGKEIITLTHGNYSRNDPRTGIIHNMPFKEAAQNALFHQEPQILTDSELAILMKEEAYVLDKPLTRADILTLRVRIEATRYAYNQEYLKKKAYYSSKNFNERDSHNLAFNYLKENRHLYNMSFRLSTRYFPGININEFE